MPVVFIHGGNVRYGGEYLKDESARNALLRRLVLKPLATKNPQYPSMEIRSPYWGNHGVEFKWNQATLPDIGVLDYLGSSDEDLPQSDFELAVTLKDLAGVQLRDSSRLEA